MLSKNAWTGKRVMITGVSGTVGQELLRQLCALDVTEIIGIDNNESELFFQEQEYADHDGVKFFLCDIKDLKSLTDRMRGCDIVIHSAAFKHVPLCEKSPRSTVATNINGVENIIDAAFDARVERVLFTSSDKAVNPTNVMGTSKLMGERLITAANMRRQKGDPIFAVTRFGNVLGSNGSVIPLFEKQIQKGGPITVTHEDMSRFIMTLEGAVRLVLTTATMFKGGEVFITKMDVINILDLAHVMVDELAPQYDLSAEDVEIKIIGPRPGEKLYEELLSDEEVRRTIESQNFFIVKPALEKDEGQYVYDDIKTTLAEMPYTSAVAPVLSRPDLREYLIKNNLITSKDKNTNKDKDDQLKVVS